jgi:hypothetical protein
MIATCGGPTSANPEVAARAKRSRSSEVGDARRGGSRHPSPAYKYCITEDHQLVSAWNISLTHRFDARFPEAGKMYGETSARNF